MAETQTVACRLHPDIKEKLEAMADERKTATSRLMEEWIREKVQESDDPSAKSDKSLPEGVYVPNSEKYDYAVRYKRDGETRRKYYKTRSGAINGAERLRA
jgi:predicted transcriptional regulator